MRTISVDRIDDHIIIKVDKDELNEKRLMQFIDYLRLETLAEKINFSEDIEQIGKEIKSNWWKNNKNTYIPKEYL